MRSAISFQLLAISLFALFLAACGPAVFDPNMRAIEAQQQAEIYGYMATGSAQAPIIAITQTAAGFAMEQAQAQATSMAGAQTQGAVWTITAQSWTPTPNATQTAVFSVLYAESTRMANVAIEDNQRIARAEITNKIRAVWGYALVLIASILAVMFSYVWMKRLSYSTVGVAPDGKPLPLLNFIDAVYTDLDKAANGTSGLSKDYLKLLPAITADRQQLVTATAQFVDLHTRRARVPKGLLELQPQPLSAADELQSDPQTNFLLPEWKIIEGWDGKTGLPYYTAKGLETMDLDKAPHLSVLGATGSGKTRRFLRPLIACALAAGHRVLIIGKAKDYWVFADHPNATLIKVSQLNKPEEALRYAHILETVVAEMNRRDDVLTAAHQSTWARAGHGRTFILCDELGNALNTMDLSNKDAANATRGWAEALAAEGRAVGLQGWFASQRATGMLGIYSQTQQAVFRVAVNEERQHRSLVGASALGEGYYFANFGASVPEIGGGFEPSDTELREFLSARSAPQLESESWIEGIVSSVPELLPVVEKAESLPAPRETLGSFLSSLSEREAKIIDLHIEGKSNRQIELEVFGSAGGQSYTKVSCLVRRYAELNRPTSSSGSVLNLGNAAA
jgi:FtsK/SpoIIIE family